ncbi:vault protein inter-alpha-trypsin domain-containing protein [Sarocladium implicatum]|nr:vault protein inter-alpha-trypsin domain-containing protein [Sarocladium implicatum]
MALNYCGCFIREKDSSVYLPRVASQAHATLFSSTSRTVLKQTFVNPRQNAALEEVSYAFPLYDGVCVVEFTCRIAQRVIKGSVKERDQAKKDFNKAKEEDKFAGLLQQSRRSGDVWMTTLGNLPAGATVCVEIAFLGELKHDAEVDGLRYTLPSIIAPRFGPQESFTKADNVVNEGMSLTVDAEMPSAIKSIQSPSHAISVSIGTTSVEPNIEPSFKRASATLSLPSNLLEKDFVLQVMAEDIGAPSAVMETHPTIPNQRALMTTLVPRFGLPPLKPEIVFLCDRSGSMRRNIPDLINALQIFLKSLPMGVKFNICSFGDRHEFLWDKSVTYNESSLEEALQYVNKFDGNFGGTEIYAPMEKTFERRFGDIELEVIMLTDGRITSQDALFNLIRTKVSESDGSVRVFSLGVGSAASSSLVEGVARVGNGVSQTTADGEKMEMKVIRLLKASLSPHITDYTLEIKYEKDDDDDDFELVEKVLTGVTLDADVSMETADDVKATEDEKGAEAAKPISLFDKTYQEDGTTSSEPSPENKFDHLPPVQVPTYLQAPYEPPPLYAFNRTTAFVLLSQTAPGQRAKSVILRGTSKQGPLELEIQVQHLKNEGTTIHQLAARKAIDDLEKTGGWLSQSKTTSGSLLKDAMPSRFSDLVEREGVRLGVTHQISSKWTSFVAIDEGSTTESEEGSLNKISIVKGSSRSDKIRKQKMAAVSGSYAKKGFSCKVGKPRKSADVYVGHASQEPPPTQESVRSVSSGKGLGSRGGALRHRKVIVDLDAEEMAEHSDSDKNAQSQSPPATDPTGDLQQNLHEIISMQAFDGSWRWSPELERILGLAKQKVMELNWPVTDESVRDQVSASVCVIAYLRKAFAGQKETWEMVVDKAEQWLSAQTGQPAQSLEISVAGLMQF